MGFTKLDEGILKSSIMAESPETFKVWIGLLASCEPDGIAKVSTVFLSSACHLSLEAVDQAIDILKSPDSRSRSKNDEGRRIIEVDGGYFIVNYEKYRGWTYSQKSEAVRKREYRKNRDINVPSVPKVPDIPPYPREVGHIGTSLGHVGTCPGHSASASGISFLNNSWINISEHDLDRWKKAYPSCDVKMELKRMIEWLRERPKYAFKDGPGAFIVAWLARTQKSIDEKKALAVEVPKTEREQKIQNDLRKR